ncbi:MAG: hypothetical protein RJA36_1462 [Pseudomonadota bacterium]|jgi:hypothetical protein
MSEPQFEPIFLVYLIGIPLIYFLPSIVARLRDHRQMPAIFLLNLFLGWTGLGWIAALVWSATAQSASPPPAPRHTA